jgi:hypothetical protein
MINPNADSVSLVRLPFASSVYNQAETSQWGHVNPLSGVVCCLLSDLIVACSIALMPCLVHSYQG